MTAAALPRAVPGLDLAEAAHQVLVAFPGADVEHPDDPAVAAAMWTARVWGNQTGWAPVAFGHGGHYKPGTTKYEFEQWEPRFYRWPDQRARLWAEAIGNAPATDVYVGVLLRGTRSRKQGAALPGPVAWADVDGQWTPQRAAALGRLGEATVWRVASGTGGRHIYLHLGDPQPPEALERWNRRLGVLLAADSGWAENKVLRLPGTLNHKPRPGRRGPNPVRWVQ